MVWVFVSSPNSYAEILMPNEMALGGGAFGVIRSWRQSPHEWSSAFIKETLDSSVGPAWEYGEKCTTQMASREQDRAGHLVLDFQPPELWGMFAVYKLPSLCCFVIAAQMDKDSMNERSFYSSPHRSFHLKGIWN